MSTTTSHRNTSSDLDYGVVLGCPRSGTTFLMSVLSTLPDAECLTGSLLPVAVPHVLNQSISSDVREALTIGFERSIDAYVHSGRFNSRAAALQKWMAAPNGLRGLLDALAGVRSISQFIYKEPFLSLTPELAYKALPAAQILHIFRDGRDCANSLVRTYDVLTDERLTHLRGSEMRIGRKYDDTRYVPWWVTEGEEDPFMESSPYVRAIWMWKYMVRRCHDFFSQPDVQASGRVMLLRYEDLMRDPVAHGNAFAQHLGVKPTSAFYKRLKGAYTGSIGNYKRRDPAEIRAAEAIAGPELALYGYC